MRMRFAYRCTVNPLKQIRIYNGGTLGVGLVTRCLRTFLITRQPSNRRGCGGREGGTYIITERKTERVYFHIRVINADTAHHITLLEEYANKRNGTIARTAERI